MRTVSSVAKVATASVQTVVNKETPVPSVPRRRRPLLAVMGVVAALVLGGCGVGQKNASDYADMEEQFLVGCNSTREADAAAGEGMELPEDFCRCAFDALSDGDTGYDFDELMKINEDLIEDPAALPDDVTAVFEGCAAPA